MGTCHMSLRLLMMVTIAATAIASAAAGDIRRSDSDPAPSSKGLSLPTSLQRSGDAGPDQPFLGELSALAWSNAEDALNVAKDPSTCTPPDQLPGCSYDLVECAEGCFQGDQCKEWSWCEHPWGWADGSNHSCVCSDARRGVDCSVMNQGYCQDGLFFDGTYNNPKLTSKYVECTIQQAGQSGYSLRLHRVNVSITAWQISNTTTKANLTWTLISRHRDSSITNRNDPRYHMCQPAVKDLDCDLQQCDILVEQNSLKYSCHYVKCRPPSAGLFFVYLELIDPKNWPINLLFSSMKPTGDSQSSLVTSSAPIALDCFTGACVTTPPPGFVPGKPPASKAWMIYAMLGAAGGLIFLLALAAFLSNRRSRGRKSSRSRSLFSTTDATSPVGLAYQDGLKAAEAGLHRRDSGGSVSTYGATEPTMWRVESPSWQPPVSLRFLNVTYDVVTKPAWWQVFGFCRRPTGPSSRSSSPDPGTPPPIGSEPPGTPAPPASGGAKERRILKGVSGMIEPGQMVALMGSSGAGKSSLLDILAGREKSGRIGGSIDYLCDWATIARREDVTGYVLQDDRLLPTETVRETLLFSARMRLPPEQADEEIEARVDAVMHELCIAKLANSRIGAADAGGGLSGGERKRVAIGVELVACSRVLFLDEPTSGLDSFSADVVMKVLRKTANAGCIVICSIHQPTTKLFRSFDKVLLLTRGGYHAYFGPPNVALSHFRSVTQFKVKDKWVNPAEVLLDLASSGDELRYAHLAESYARSPLAKAVLDSVTSRGGRTPTASPARPYGEPVGPLGPPSVAPNTHHGTFERVYPSSFDKFWLLCGRGYRQIMRDPSLLMAQFAVTCCIALAVGGIFYHLNFKLEGVHNRTGFLFFVVVYFSLASMSSLNVFFQEKLSFLRERAGGFYTTLPYFFSKLMCDMLPLRVFPPLAFGGIVYFMIGLHDKPEFFLKFLLAITLINISATSLCYFVSSFAGSVSKSNLITSLIFVFNILFGGLLLTARNPLIRTIMRFALFNYGWQVLMVNEFQGVTHLEFNPKGGLAVTITGDAWLDNLGIDVYENDHLYQNGVLYLAGISVLLLAAAYTVLSVFQSYVK